MQNAHKCYSNEEIRIKAEKLKDKYNAKIPIDIKSIAENEGFIVVTRSLKEYEGTITNKAISGISGVLYTTENAKEIWVNEEDPEQRRNFTIAHELGHYYLHGGKENTKGTFVSFRGDKNPIETEANKFAAELLLPTDDVKQVYEDTLFIPTVSYLASKFNVSDQAMRIKLEQMGLRRIG